MVPTGLIPKPAIDFEQLVYERIAFWVKQFNDSRKRDNYLTVDWKLLLPRKVYSMCTNDTVSYEQPWPDESLPVFPHRMVKGKYNLINLSPFGNTMTKDLAIEAIKGTTG